ncbi:MAG: sugar transferase [Chloroflexi bacterium]|nr:sugar transferase [Chloroflexota bacterium]
MTTFYRRHGKRLLDLALTIPALILLAPVMGMVALAVRLTMGRPILFRQVRPGLHAVPFTMYKFRTMTDSRDADGHLLPEAQRITRLGRFLRRTSLDELPELWNVLRGEMSLVGPRPLLVKYLDRYTPNQARRHEARPGITGLAQISGRQAMPFSRRLEFDVSWVDSYDLWIDLRILLLTIPKTLSARGVVLGQEVGEVDDLGLSG